MQGYSKNEGIKIVPYNPLWKRIADDEIIFLKKVLGADLMIEHFGSTAIVGCCAKDIVDIQIWANSIDEKNKIIQILSSIYQGVSSPKSQAEGFLCFDKEVEKNGLKRRTHHIHVQSDWEKWKRALDFRDYLNDNPTEILNYVQIKEEAREKFPNDMTAYSQTKNDYINGILYKID